MNDFFSPYLWALYGGAYNIQQSLEGAGLATSNAIELDASGQIVGSYWSPAEAVLEPFGFLILFSVVLFVCVMSAAYVLGRWKGCVIALLFIALPGALNVAGLWPDISYVPRTYVIDGVGVLGQVNGFVPIVVLALLLGWSLVVNISDLFALGEKFRIGYDHFWFCSAVLTGIFFVASLDAGKAKDDLLASNEETKQASQYLSRQIEVYDRICSEEGRTDSASCQWASKVHRTLQDYAHSHYKIFIAFGPKQASDLYFKLPGLSESDSELRVRRELVEFNSRMCPTRKINESLAVHSPASVICQIVPPSFCTAYPLPPANLVDRHVMMVPVAIANECIIPSLMRFRALQERYSKAVSEEAISKHAVWLYYILFAVFAGGKIANGTTRFVALELRPVEERSRVKNVLFMGLRFAGTIAALLKRISMDNLIASYKLVHFLMKKISLLFDRQ